MGGVARHHPHADVDGDGDGPDKTTIIDLTLAFCEEGAVLGSACYHPEADLDRDGDIDNSDVGLATGKQISLPPGHVGNPDADVYNTVGWSGSVHDHVSDLDHLRMREWSPFRARWLQRDPAGYMDSMNLYGYGWGNPVGVSDPFGLQVGPSGDGYTSSDPVQFGSTIQPSIQDGQISIMAAAMNSHLPIARYIEYFADYRNAIPNLSKERRPPRIPNVTYWDVIVSHPGQWMWAMGDAAVYGVGQGALNTVNGLQDSAIGIVNLSMFSQFSMSGQMMRMLGFEWEIPSPDWSEGVFVEGDSLHGVSKFAGSFGVEGLTGAWLGRAGKAAQTMDEIIQEAANQARRQTIRRAGESAASFGTRTHTQFASIIEQLKAAGRLTARLRVEVSYQGGITVNRGLAGSVRIDLILYDNAGTGILRLWDLKTGLAGLTKSRIQQLLRQLGLPSNFPIDVVRPM